MSHYKHLSMEEREKILVHHAKNQSLRSIGKLLGRSPSTISREIKRNRITRKRYSAFKADLKYCKRRRNCKRHKLLENNELRRIVSELFLEQQWSPEEISNRLKYENNSYHVSYSTIYRGIYAGMLDEANLSRGNRGAIRKLRHRGKTRRRKEEIEKRGRIAVSNTIHQRPKEAFNRQVIGHWEVDTVAGKTGSACLVTITDMCSRYLLSEKISKKNSQLVASKMISMLSNIPSNYVKSLTPDRGKEFSKHTFVSSALGNVEFYFADPHSPWQRGTNENTNGLLREYLPKSFDIALCSDADISVYVDKLNKRPRKCLDWKTPYEVFFDKALHLT